MAVIIRCARTGRNKIATYRIVAADSRMKRDGRFLENLGTYNPQANPKQFTIKTDRVAEWLKKGAELSATVAGLLKQDRFRERSEAMAKGVDVATLNISRRPERTCKRKPRPKKASES